MGDCFQPSMKLVAKQVEGRVSWGSCRKRYRWRMLKTRDDMQ